MVFMSNVAARAAKFCDVFVADATFEVAPLGFEQVYFILGLFKPNKDSDEAEWVR